MNPSIADPAAAALPELWVILLKSAAMLSIVLALLIGALFLMRRLFYGNTRVAGGNIIRTIASSHVAPKVRIVLIEVLGQVLLLGVTPNAVHCLAKLPADGSLKIPESAAADRFFPNLLKHALTVRNPRHEPDPSKGE